MSFDTDMTDEESREFSNKLESNGVVLTARHTSDGSLEKAYKENKKIYVRMQEIIRKKYLDDKDILELIYFVRNTLSVYPINAIMNLG